MIQKYNSIKGVFFTFLFMLSFAVSARGVYQTETAFLQEVFAGDVPKSRVIWLKGEVRSKITQILGHPYPGLRIRYWAHSQRSAWILEEIGKTQPITFGIVINKGEVERAKVLAFRESRGDEIRYPAFTRQFISTKLQDNTLDKQIDGISGATLSVRAITRMVTLALYLHTLTG